MKEVSLRMAQVGYDRLVATSDRFGTTFQGFLEAAVIVALDDEPDPDLWELHESLWPVMQRLKTTPGFQVRSREKVKLRLEDDLAARLAEKCRQYEVSQNTALCLIVMPWPEEDRETYEVYQDVYLDRIVRLARKLDSGRRRLRGGARGVG